MTDILHVGLQLYALAQAGKIMIRARSGQWHQIVIV